MALKAVVLVAFAGTATLVGQGCDALGAVKDHVSGMVPDLCKTGVETIFTDSDKLYLPVLERKCRYLRDQALTQNLPEEKATEIHDNCMDAAKVILNEKTADEIQSSIDDCAKKVTDAMGGNFDLSAMKDAVTKFTDSVNVKDTFSGEDGHFDNSDLNSEVNDKIVELGKDAKVTVEEADMDKESTSSDAPAGTDKKDEAPAETDKKDDAKDAAAEEKKTERRLLFA